ncbi:MG2 domain-containing protein [Patescibacteria group bacterium]
MKLKGRDSFFHFLIAAGIFFSWLVIFHSFVFPIKTFSPKKLTPELSEKDKVLAAQADYADIFFAEGDKWRGRSGIISLTSADEPTISVGSYKTSGEAEIEVYQAEESTILNFLLHDGEGNQVNKEVDESSLQLIGSTKENINAGQGSRTEFILPIEESGLYYLKIKLNDLVESAFIVRSRTGVITKEGDNELIFWGQDFSSRRSINNGEVTVYGLQNNLTELAKANFDSDGIAKTSLDAKADVALVRVNDSLALIPINLKHLNSYYYGYFKPKQKAAKIFIFSDRPIYKPGEKVYFKSIIRNDDDARYSLPSGNAQVKATRDYSNKEIVFKKDYLIDSQGSVSGEFELPADIKTGHYNLHINLDPTSENRSLKRTIGFRVEHFRKPEQHLEIIAPQREYITGDKSFVTVKGEYFFGQPVSDQQVKYQVFAANYFGYYYSEQTKPIALSDDYLYSYYRGNTIKTGEVTLNQDGEAQIELDFTLPGGKYKTQVFSIEAKLNDETGNPSLARKNILVYSGQYSIFRDGWGRSTRVNEQAQLKLILAPNLGGSVSQIPLKAKVKRTTWVKYQKPDKKYPSYRKEVENLPEIQTVSDDQGKAIFNFIPQKEGSYNLTVEGQDTNGNTISNQFYLWVRAKDKPLYTGQQDDGLSLDTDKEKYSHTDKAQLTITSEIPNRDVFLSLDRAWVNRFQVVRLDGNSAAVEVPLVETDIPNIFAKVVSFSDHQLETDSQSLIVSTDPKKLQLTLTPDKEKYGPGETVTVNIQATDIAGNPLSTNLAVWAVDKAIFELTDRNYSKIIPFFWNERYDNTQQAHSLQNIGIRTAEMGGCFGPETPILMANGQTKKIKKLQNKELILTRKNKNNSQLVKAKVSNVHSREITGYFIINQHLKVTPNHLLWVDGKWQEASKIQLGDILVNSRDQKIPVSSLEWQIGKLTVYNFTVEKHQTYFAGDLWVHNNKGGGGDIREIFESTAYWNPSVQTDTHGQAQVRFELPDNLTTWVLASIGSTLDTKVGEKYSEITVTKDVIIRPILPNILRTDDQAILSALVQNFTDQERSFEISLESSNLDLKSKNPIQTIITPGGIEQVYWQVQPKEENEKTKLTFSTKDINDGQYSDTIIQEFPVRLFGFWEKRGENNEGSSQFSIQLAPDSHQEKSTATLFLSSTFLGTLPAAMEYLVQYPYGCVEQTTSRFVPAVIAKANPDLFEKSIANKDINNILKKGVKRLGKLQKPNGGWTWWYAGRSDSFITAYVVEYLLKAKDLGVKVDQTMLDQAKTMLENDKCYNRDNNKSLACNHKDNAARKYGLTLLGSDKANQISVDQNDLTPDLLALFIISNLKNNQNNPETNGLNLLVSQAKTEGDWAYWEKGQQTSFGSKDASTALALRAIAASGSHQELATKVTRYLLSQRQMNYWSNTFATAQVVQAAVDFAKAQGELTPNYSYTVKLDDQLISQGKVTHPMQIIKSIILKGTEIKENGSQLVIEKSEGTGQLYSTLLVKEFHQDKKAKAVDHGLKIKREYVNQKGPEYDLGVGDIVEVKLTVSGLGSPIWYGVIADELPSGMIPINPSFKNEQFRLNRSPYYHYGAFGREITENGMVLSLRHMNYGTQTYSYQARVISEGEFLTPPTTVSLMYSPEIYGRSEVNKIKIEKQSKTKLLPIPTVPVKAFQKSETVPAMALIIIFLALLVMVIIFLKRKGFKSPFLKKKQSEMPENEKPKPPEPPQPSDQEFPPPPIAQ